MGGAGAGGDAYGAADDGRRCIGIRQAGGDHEAGGLRASDRQDPHEIRPQPRHLSETVGCDWREDGHEVEGDGGAARGQGVAKRGGAGGACRRRLQDDAAV